VFGHVARFSVNKSHVVLAVQDWHRNPTILLLRRLTNGSPGTGTEKRRILQDLRRRSVDAIVATKKAQADPSAAVRKVPAAALVVASAAEQSRAE
jgi:hypothetical protein